VLPRDAGLDVPLLTNLPPLDQRVLAPDPRHGGEQRRRPVPDELDWPAGIK